MNSMKSWSVYLPNGEAVTVVGEIECREGKYYFKNGDDVVAVFNDDKVCGVHGVYTPRSKDNEALVNYYALLLAVKKKFPAESRFETALRYIKESEQCKQSQHSCGTYPKSCEYPQGDEG